MAPNRAAATIGVAESDLDEGVRMMTRITAAPTDVQIGSRVCVVFTRADVDVTLLYVALL